MTTQERIAIALERIAAVLERMNPPMPPQYPWTYPTAPKPSYPPSTTVTWNTGNN